MAELSPIAKKVYDGLSKLGATSEAAMKSADQVMEVARMGKGQIAAGLAELEKLGIVERKAREKRSGYFVKNKV